MARVDNDGLKEIYIMLEDAQEVARLSIKIDDEELGTDVDIFDKINDVMMLVDDLIV